jgi:phage terminase large subunit GpA-like protein
VSSWAEGFRDGLRPDAELTVSQWADRFRVLSSKASAEPGPFRCSRTPYIVEPLDCLSSSSTVQRVVLMFAAQTGKTELGMSWLGYCIQASPGPMLAIQPTVEMAKRLSKQRLESMIQETPCLNELIAPARSRDSGNTLFSKEYPGGILLLTGANSATGLRSAPCRYIFGDEIDAFPVDVDGEGDPVSLAEKRATTFARRKILLTSTPTIKDHSRIEAEYLRSDMRRYFVPCPKCGHMQWLKWEHVKWEDNDPSTARYECEGCGERFSDRHKPQMLRNGEWRATAEGDGKTAGFQLSGLYSPLGWFSWADMVEEFLRAKNDAPALKTWINTRAAETWQEDYASKISADGLRSRCEPYEYGVLPEGSLALTFGIDVQDNRLAISGWAWGRQEEGWLIYHQEIYGDPSRADLWKQVDEAVLREWSHASGAKLRPDVVAIDSGGHFTAEVYQFARERVRQGVIAVKGASSRNRPPISRGNRVDINSRGKTLKKGAMVYSCGVDTVKTTLFARLKHNEAGEGYLHFPEQATDEYFQQLTAERQVLKHTRGGFPVREWIKKPNARNESLDTLVYSYCALNHLYTRRDRRTIWDQLEKRLEEPAKGQLNSRQRPASPVNSSYVRDW